LLALHHVHSRKVLHRDIKSQNVFIAANGSIKIGDLGVAKLLGTRMQFATTVVGTPYYLSPELCEGKPYNEKSDIWAIGVLLYEMCTVGKMPFEASNQGALIMRIIRGKFDALPQDLDPEFGELCRLMLERLPSSRPAISDIFRRRRV
jgi:NIMA (never in mitosis gene a)-related kinase